ncbi:hypothetical protein CBR_g34686 [Chara braunii]|uniref:Uncharacterized protein n=1 Tax=Chara braunii TaxID=69332 RepID=A0A388JYX8_CHABU|nr:hypothetical protein CBR_g34686 [Chara braunii]|eukprot:GBG62986.1 hypothetical protein CBR_g34686 [Chara braunii]
MTLRSARGPVSHVSIGPEESDRELFRGQRERRARAAEARRAFASEASAIAAMATTTMSTSAQQTSQARSLGTVGSTVVQTNTTANALRYNGAVHCALHTLRSEGIRGLYRGATSSFVGVSIESSVLFGVYSQMKMALQGSALLHRFRHWWRHRCWREAPSAWSYVPQSL